MDRKDPKSVAAIMMITANDGFIDQSQRYAFDNAGQSKNKYTILLRGELAYNHGASRIRPYGSCFALDRVDTARVPFVYHCFSVPNHDSSFVSTVLNSTQVAHQLRKLVSSGARMDGLLNISFPEYQTVKIQLPDISEQKKITALLSGTNNLITLHQCHVGQNETNDYNCWTVGDSDMTLWQQ